MTALIIQLALYGFLGLFAIHIAYKVGHRLGRESLTPALDKLWRYQRAVDALNRWCGHTSPHARLIARHLVAHGEGQGYNAGTPAGDEACDIGGLREQLKMLEGVSAIPEVAAWRAARREAGRATDAYYAALIEARAKDELHGFGHTSVDAEYQAMNSASNAVIGLVRPMLAALDKT